MDENGNPDGGEPSGVGLLGIQERVKMLSGTFQLTSKPEKGTRIIVTLPRKNV
jgi:signal transduction histidine kinase